MVEYERSGDDVGGLGVLEVLLWRARQRVVARAEPRSPMAPGARSVGNTVREATNGVRDPACRLLEPFLTSESSHRKNQSGSGSRPTPLIVDEDRTKAFDDAHVTEASRADPNLGPSCRDPIGGLLDDPAHPV